MTEESRIVCERILKRFGLNAQSKQACHEVGEFMQAVNDCLRYGTEEDTKNLVERMSDMLITFEQLKAAYAIMDSEIEDMIQAKLDRQLGQGDDMMDSTMQVSMIWTGTKSGIPGGWYRVTADGQTMVMTTEPSEAFMLFLNLVKTRTRTEAIHGIHSGEKDVGHDQT